MKKKNNTNPEFDFTDAFFKEVSEDVHNDNLKAFWKKYGVQVVAFVAVCLTCAVSFETIKHWRDVSNQKWSNAFANAQVLQKQGNIDDSIKILENIAKKGNDIYADEANMEIINIMFEQNKTDEALKKLEEFISNANNDKLRTVALIKLATYKIDNSSPEEISKLLSPIIDDENSVWILEGKELLALSYLNANQKDKALAIYEEISKNNNANEILRIRAKNMISVLTSSGESK